jgi:4-hydroxy-tetrahydrodipicolinate reductase
VHFGLPGERLVMRHDSDADGAVFVHGSLLAAQRIQATTGLVRGLDTLLFGAA